MEIKVPPLNGSISSYSKACTSILYDINVKIPWLDSQILPPLKSGQPSLPGVIPPDSSGRPCSLPPACLETTPPSFLPSEFTEAPGAGLTKSSLTWAFLGTGQSVVCELHVNRQVDSPIWTWHAWGQPSLLLGCLHTPHQALNNPHKNSCWLTQSYNAPCNILSISQGKEKKDIEIN